MYMDAGIGNAIKSMGEASSVTTMAIKNYANGLCIDWVVMSETAKITGSWK